MGIATDPFFKHEMVQEAIRDDRARMLRILLTTKFGALPKWVTGELSVASANQIERWSKKILSVDTLEGVLSKE